jgi:hypothetical protein
MRVYLWLLCLLMPVSCVWVGEYVFWTVTDRAWVFPQLFDVLLFQSLLVALPFVLLALHAERRMKNTQQQAVRRFYVRSSVAGVLVTLVPWALYFWDGYTYWAEKKTYGADIGLGCFMMLSPLLVLLAMRVAAIGYRSAMRTPHESTA